MCLLLMLSGTNFKTKNAAIIPGIIARGVYSMPSFSTIKITYKAPRAYPRFPPNEIIELLRPLLLPPKSPPKEALGG